MACCLERVLPVFDVVDAAGEELHKQQRAKPTFDGEEVGRIRIYPEELQGCLGGLVDLLF